MRHTYLIHRHIGPWYPGLTVPLVCVCILYFRTLGLRYPYVSGFYRYLAGKNNRGVCVFASRMVLWLLLEPYCTLVAVSAPLVMPLHDLDNSKLKKVEKL
jgi:hypothetical protein